VGHLSYHLPRAGGLFVLEKFKLESKGYELAQRVSSESPRNPVDGAGFSAKRKTFVTE
jgi:hypothetical protein